MKCETQLFLLLIVAFMLFPIEAISQALLLPTRPGYVRGDGDCADIEIAAVSDYWRVSKGGKMRFWAVQQMNKHADLEFQWTVINGQILRGQGTWEIEVKAGKEKTKGYLNASGFVQVSLKATRRSPGSKCTVETRSSIMIGRHVESNTQVYDLSVTPTMLKLPCPSDLSLNRNMSVSVNTVAQDPDSDPLTFRYFVDVGRIVGDGPNVTWDLSNVSTGTYTITAGVEDSLCGFCRNTVTRIVRVVACDSEA